MEEIVNKVAQSGLVTLDLKNLLPEESDIIGIDLVPFLFQGLLLREKDFRASMKELDWSVYQGKHVAVYCSTDAIVPMWAYMLMGAYLAPIAASFTFATPAIVRQQLLINNIETLDVAPYEDGRIIIKGCGDETIPEAAFFAITKKLHPRVKTLMYGEPCSTVPIYKRK